MKFAILLILEVIFNISLPLAGVLFLNWSIGDIFILFFLEMLIRASITVIKLFFAFGANLFIRIGNILSYVLQFSFIFLFMFILSGNFFDGTDKQIQSQLDEFTVTLVFGSYFINSLLPFFIAGTFKKALPKIVLKESLKFEAILFLILLLLLFTFSFFTPFAKVNFILALGLIIGKNTVAIVLNIIFERKKNKAL